MGCGYLLWLQSHLPPAPPALTFRDDLSLAGGIWKQASADPSWLKYLRINNHKAFDDIRSDSFPHLSSTTSRSPLLFGLNFAGNLLVNDSHVPFSTLLKQKPHILTPSRNHIVAGLVTCKALTFPAGRRPPLCPRLCSDSSFPWPVLPPFLIHLWLYFSSCNKFYFDQIKRRALEFMLQNTLYKPKMSILLFRQIFSCSNSITIDSWNFSAFENTTYLAICIFSIQNTQKQQCCSSKTRNFLSYLGERLILP